MFFVHKAQHVFVKNTFQPHFQTLCGSFTSFGTTCDTKRVHSRPPELPSVSGDGPRSRGRCRSMCLGTRAAPPPHGPLFTSERSTREFLQKHGRVVKLGEPVLRIWHLGGYPDVFIFRNHKPFRSFPHQFHAKLASCRASPLRPGRDDLGSGSNWGCHLGPTGIR